MLIQYNSKKFASICQICFVCLFFHTFFQKGYWYWILILQFFWHTDTDTYSVFFKLNTDTDTSLFENHTGYWIHFVLVRSLVFSVFSLFRLEFCRILTRIQLIILLWILLGNAACFTWMPLDQCTKKIFTST